MSTLQNKKFQHFVYAHTILFFGLLCLPISSIVYTLIFYILVVQPFLSVVYHSYFNHGYIKFKNPIVKCLSVYALVLISFWKLEDLKSYHIAHHTEWPTNSDPTTAEVAQGLIKYYVGTTKPINFHKVKANADPIVDWFNKNFYTVKLASYGLIFLLAGFKALLLGILIQQFYMFFFSKMHDLIFHSKTNTNDLPWLFVLFFDDAWHIEHHREYSRPQPHRLRLINMQYWWYKLLFRN